MKLGTLFQRLGRCSGVIIVIGGMSVFTTVAIMGAPISSALSPPTTEVPIDNSGEEGAVINDPSGSTTTVAADVVDTIPASCVVPTPVVATFIGRLKASDRRTARFDIMQMRGGSLDGYAINNLVDIDYAGDVGYLEIEQSYIVATGLNVATGKLYSKIRDPQPLYGGSQVIGVNLGVSCPQIEDAVRTLTLQGRSVESGVLAPLKQAKARLGRAFLLPFLWVFGGLLGLATVRALLIIIWRSGRRAWNGT